jgi:hypothetical protein
MNCTTLAQERLKQPGTRTRRRAALIATLRRALARGAQSVGAMIALAELCLEAGDSGGALVAAKMGIKFVFERSRVRRGLGTGYGGRWARRGGTSGRQT